MKGEFLLEIGCEEIPARVLPNTIAEMKDLGLRLLAEARIPAKSVEAFATPRRLVLRGVGIPTRQEARVTEVSGPPRSAGFDAQGRPTAAAEGFAKAQGVSVKDLQVKNTGKGDYLVARRSDPSVPSAGLLRDLLPRFIDGLSFPKTMRWEAGSTRFARPIRSLLAIFDGRTVPFSYGGLNASNRARGHRFMANRPFVVRGFADYVAGLKRNRVILDPAEREKVIRSQASRLARSVKGTLEEDAGLIEQAVFLTEWPTVLLGRFDPDFLSLPPAVLATAMGEHQGDFAVRDLKGRLLPVFIFVSDVAPKDTKTIRTGNERVVRARLEDARFYFSRDRAERLESRVESLKQLVYHDRLGTVYQKAERLGRLGAALLSKAGGDAQSISRVQTAAKLCKTDLLTGMVREFPTLQGIMGREYALREGVEAEVAQAIAEHYYPRNAEDQSDPKTRTGKFLTAADRLDSLVGFFGVDLAPTGSMDPFALRRQGMGLLMVVLDEAFADVPLGEAIEAAVAIYAETGTPLKKDAKGIRQELDRFLAQRMETFLKRRFGEQPGFSQDLAETLLVRPIDRPVDLYRRFVALLVFRRRPEFEPLMTAFKRASRIVPPEFRETPRADRFSAPVEERLFTACTQAKAQFDQEMAAKRYEDALGVLAGLRPAIAAFFEGVMVMDQNPEIKQNRLALLAQVRDLFDQYGDFNRVTVESAAG